MSVAIKIENVSKLYRLGTVGTGTISHDLNRWWHSIRGKEDPYAKVGQVNDRTKGATSSDSATPSSHSPLATSDSYVWALRDINLEVAQGEILGIIGRNGAGKSTLLKLLSRVTAPTTGRIKTKGRIASLLEVGTGFHPELTGRENIYMNGAILGMRRDEISHHLDAIVSFSGCEKYLDTPTKRYSSGMTVRLGFAVAAHLDCKILVVDEVLAVGDAEFQKKCIGRMRDVGADGRTILFVSHNMSAVRALCSKAVVIEQGTVSPLEDVGDALQRYSATNTGSNTQEWNANREDKQKHRGEFTPLRLRLIGTDRETILPQVPRTDSVAIEATFELSNVDPLLTVGVAFFDQSGGYLFHSFHKDSGESATPPLSVGTNTIQMECPLKILNEQRYRIVLIAAIHRRKWILHPDESVASVELVIAGGFETSRFWINGRRGTIAPVLAWRKSRQ